LDEFCAVNVKVVTKPSWSKYVSAAGGRDEPAVIAKWSGTNRPKAVVAELPK